MKVTLDASPSNAPCCMLLTAEDGRDVLIQADWDYPGIASNLGFSLLDVQVVNANYYGVPCSHDGTDGTIDCKDCGLKAGTFIAAARDFLDEHDGDSFEDPGYFTEP